MKKRRIIVLLSACLVIGSVSVYAASPNPNIETMQNVGQLFKSYENNTDDSIFAKGKSGGIITKKDIEQSRTGKTDLSGRCVEPDDPGTNLYIGNPDRRKTKETV